MNAVLEWLGLALLPWQGAAIVGGVLILAVERWDRRREPSEADVRRAAQCYRDWYGADASRVIEEHIFAAAFSPDGRHRRFLRRVRGEMQAP